MQSLFREAGTFAESAARLLEPQSIPTFEVLGLFFGGPRSHHHAMMNL
jgi:hypothetical protein